jgi:hypothetical protein
MVSAKHDAYLNKLSAIARKAALEPQERDNITNTITLFNNCRHRDTSIARFLASVIRDCGDDVGRSPDLPTLDCSFKVLRNGRRCNFSHRRNLSFLSQFVKCLLNSTFESFI